MKQLLEAIRILALATVFVASLWTFITIEGYRVFMGHLRPSATMSALYF